MKMKRIIALLMILMLALPLVACQTTEDPTATPTAGTTTPEGTTATKAPETTEEVVYDLPLKAGTYEITHVSSGKKIETDKYGKLAAGDDVQYSVVSVDWVTNKDKAFYRIGLFGIEQKKHNDSDVVFDNIEVVNCLAVDRLKDKSDIKQDYDSLTNTKEMWKLYPNEDGTFTIAPALRATKSRITVIDGVIKLVDVDENTNLDDCKWTFTSKSTDNPIYYECVSEKGNAIVRVPLDVFDQKNYDGPVFDKETGKLESYIPTENTIQKYADNVQLTYDTYVDLTDFVPYSVIIVHGYNYQGVMAGVVGGNNNVFVNCGPGEWFYSDLFKMEYRMTKMGRNDVNFMVLHEMGHMFDWDRGWTFESEMQADLKAAYLLHTVEGTYAAPAEYPQGTCFGKDIGTGGFKGLSGGTMAVNPADKKNPSGYSIYRNAEIFTEFCNVIGWEALKETFHWYQSEEGRKEAPSSASSYEKFKMFVDKLSEYGEKDLWAMFAPAELASLEMRFEKPTEEPTPTPED